MKKHLHFDAAERMAVIEQNTLAEISLKLSVAESTLRNWSREGKWDEKRKQYLESRQAFHEELYEFARSLMKTINDDMRTGAKVDTGRLYTLGRILPMITKVKDYEDVAKSAGDGKTEGITEDVVKTIEREILGIGGK